MKDKNNLYTNLTNLYNLNDENFKEFLADLYKEMLTNHNDVKYIKEHLTEEIEKKLEKFLINGGFNVNIKETVNNYINNSDVISNLNNEVTQNKNKINEYTNKVMPYYIAYELANDGITNVTNELQNLLDNNKVVVLPEGDYAVDTIYLNSGNMLMGKSNKLTRIISRTNTPCIETIDKSNNIKIKDLMLECKSKSKGIRLKCSDNNNLEEFDLKHELENVTIMHSIDFALSLDEYCRECRINNVKVMYGDEGIIINGTDNFIINCTVSNMNKRGFYFGANNKIDMIKAFLCNKTSGNNAIEFGGYGCNATNVCAQQNYKTGICIYSTGGNINFVSDSNGFSNPNGEKCGLNVIGRYNTISGSVIDGRLKGSMDYGLKLEKTAKFNNINVTFISHSSKELNSLCLPYKFELAPNSNDVKINGEIINSINNNNSKYIVDETTFTFKNDANGNYTKENKNLYITMDGDLSAINTGWGNSYRVTINDDTNYKYLTIETDCLISNQENTDQVNARIGVANNNGSITNEFNIDASYINKKVNNYQKMYITIDLTLLRANTTKIVVWFGAFKQNSLTNTLTQVKFINPKYYFSN